MILKSISLENFQSYYGNQSENEFQFLKGVNIICGSNGAGKSKLFNAFHWVLFGKIFTNHEWIITESKPKNFISNKAKYNCEEGEKIKCSVKLIFIADNYESNDVEVEYTYERKVVVEKKNNDWNVVTPEKLEISYLNTNGETIFIDEPKNDEITNYVFPIGIRKYMWFQGEAIDSLIDFTNKNTLKLAVDKISYYPKYEILSDLASASNSTISRAINTHIRKSSRTEKEAQKIVNDLEEKIRNREYIITEISKLNNKIDDINININNTESALKNYDKFRDYSARKKDIENKDGKLALRMDNLEGEYREKFVSKWMLFGTEHMVMEASNRLNEIQKYIKEHSKTNNPIPMQVPGRVFIEKMLEDQRCHICEREALKGSSAYTALEKRIEDSNTKIDEYNKKNEFYKSLEFKYVDLSNQQDNLLSKIRSIDNDVKNWTMRMDALVDDRIKLREERNLLEEEIEFNEIDRAYDRLDKIMSDHVLFQRERNKLKTKVSRLERELLVVDKLINELREKRQKSQKSNDIIGEQKIEKYFLLLEDIMLILKENARKKLLYDIEVKANDLYKKYLENSTSPRGYLQIDTENYSINILDDERKKDVSQGQEVAAKMSVINAILYLSTKKMNKSYPLVADAPSSVFDDTNTKSYTKKISETFEQVILISKDYSTESDLQYLSDISEISRIYWIENRALEKEKNSSEINHQTIIEKYK